jgi:hypothetical protein
LPDVPPSQLYDLKGPSALQYRDFGQTARYLTGGGALAVSLALLFRATESLGDFWFDVSLPFLIGVIVILGLLAYISGPGPIAVTVTPDLVRFDFAQGKPRAVMVPVLARRICLGAANLSYGSPIPLSPSKPYMRWNWRTYGLSPEAFVGLREVILRAGFREKVTQSMFLPLRLGLLVYRLPSR